MKYLNFIQFTILALLISLCMIQCTDDGEVNSLSPDQEVELRRDANVVGPGTGGSTDHYGECSDVEFYVVSAMYNSLENVICCNYATLESMLEVGVYGVDESHDLEWNVQGTNVISSDSLTVFTGIGCPSVGECNYLSFQIIDHTLECKATFLTEVCNNVGSCFIGGVEDCYSWETWKQCFCRKFEEHPDCKLDDEQ